MENVATNLNNKSVCMRVNNIFKESPELAKLGNSALYIEESRYCIKPDYLEFFLQLRISTYSNIYRTS